MRWVQAIGSVAWIVIFYIVPHTNAHFQDKGAEGINDRIYSVSCVIILVLFYTFIIMLIEYLWDAIAILLKTSREIKNMLKS